MEIGQSIKKIREWRNYSQKYMADELEISQQTYSRYETGDVDFSISKLQKIAEILEVPTEYILKVDEKAIFSHYKMDSVVQEGNGNNVGTMYSDPKLLEKLEEQYEARIRELKAHIAELKTAHKERIEDLQKEVTHLKTVLEKTLKS